MYVCVYAHIYTYKCIYVHIHIYNCMYTYVHTYKHICIFICVFIHTHIHIHKHISCYTLIHRPSCSNFILKVNVNINETDVGKNSSWCGRKLSPARHCFIPIFFFFLSPPIISPSPFCLRISISLAVLRASSLSSPLLRSLSSVPSTAEGSRYINLLVPLSSSDCRAGRTRSDAQSQPAHSSCFRRTV